MSDPVKQEVLFFKDKAGQIVQVGDYILYAQAHGRSAALAFGKVLKIEVVVEPHRTKYYIKNIGVDDVWFHADLKLNGATGTLQYPDRIINANEFIPEDYKAVFKGTKYE